MAAPKTTSAQVAPAEPAQVVPLLPPACAEAKERTGLPDGRRRRSVPENSLDRTVHAFVARLFGGLSPLSLAAAWFDWASHLALSPGRQFELAEMVGREAIRLMREAGPMPAREPPGCRAGQATVAIATRPGRSGPSDISPIPISR